MTDDGKDCATNSLVLESLTLDESDGSVNLLTLTVGITVFCDPQIKTTFVDEASPRIC